MQSRARSWWFILYLSLLLGVTFWFFIFYPEPLYFGTSGAALKKEVPSIIIADPRLSLIMMAATLFSVVFVYNFLILGAMSHRLMKLLAQNPGPGRGRFLAAFAMAQAPLLFWVPLMSLRFFFFERWINLRPLYPFIDWTGANILHLALAGAIYAWKLWLQVRLNQAAFKTSLPKAMVPAAIELTALAALLHLPLLFNEQLFNAFKDTLT